MTTRWTVALLLSLTASAQAIVIRHNREDALYQQSPFPMRPIIFHLEDGTSGYIGVALADAGQIDHLSLFVMENICPDGAACTQTRSLEDLMKAAGE